MQTHYCGLDFGTSNSTLGVFKHNQAELVPLEADGSHAIRSAIFMNEEDRQIHFGKRAMADYLAHEEGRLLIAIKSVLGSPLMNEQTRVFNRMVPFTEILGYFIKHLKNQAEQHAGHELENVVMGRPVHFDDDNPEIDKKAEDTLAAIARAQGFKNIVFQYEPIAAATAFKQSNPDGSLALIVDIGGGTSDFTILRIGNQASHSKDDILASAGVHIGGTDIDRQLSLKKVMPLLGMGSEMKTMTGKQIPLPMAPYIDLSTWHKINLLYTNKERHYIQDLLKDAIDKTRTSRLLTVLENRDGHRILQSCEAQKIHLSEQSDVEMTLDYIERELSLEITQTQLNQIMQSDVARINATIHDMLTSCGLTQQQIDVVFFTGGTSKLPYIQSQVLSQLPNAQAVNGDVFGSVGLGLTYSAQEIFAG